MASVTLLGTTFSTANGTKTVTATPAIGDLIVIFVAHTGNTSSANPTDNNSDGAGVYDISDVASVSKNGGADTMHCFIRRALIGSASSTVFTHAPGGTSGGGLCVLNVSGMTRTGNAAELQAAGQSLQGAGGTPAPVLGATPQSANPIAGAVFNTSNPAGMTPRTGYTEHSDVGYNTPTSGLEVMSLNSGESSATITWGGTSATAFCDLAIELDTSPPQPKGVTLTLMGVG